MLSCNWLGSGIFIAAMVSRLGFVESPHTVPWWVDLPH